MQLVEELNRSLRSKNLKRAYNIYSRMQARAYPQALLDASLQRIKRSYALINDKPTAYGFEKDLAVLRLDTSSIQKHQFYSHIEEISQDLKVSGWCYSGIDGSKESSFLVLIEEQPYRIFRTSILRGDVSGKFKTSGYWGYEFSLPPEVVNMARAEGQLKIEIRSPYGESFEEQIASEIIDFSKGTESKIFPIGEAEEVTNSFKDLDLNKIDLNKGRSVSIILLNLNGGDMVVHSIQSIVDKMRPSDELIIVDHGSDDGSIEQIKQCCEKENNIIVWERGENYTFSESNNRAVERAKNEIVVFINNDIVLEDGTFDDLSKVLGEEKIEIVGGLLYDAPIEEFSIKYRNSFPRCLQHRGIGLKIGGENFIQAYDINTLHTPQERESDYLQVAATTGAVMAIRKEFFLEIGGFSEKYIYGQEDVDICLRASLEHEKKIAVCNKFKALHFHGYTRLRQNSKHKTKGLNLLRNRILLNDYFDVQIRKKLKDKSFLDNINPVKANCKRIAFIVSDLSIKTSKGDVFTAFELAYALNNKYNCECYFLLPNKKIDCKKFDIIINFIHSARIDILDNLRSDTLIIAWMRNWFDKWCQLPDIDIYDIIYCSSKHACSYVEDQIKFSVKYLPLAAGADAVQLGRERKSNDKDSKKKNKSYTFIGSYFNSPREITKLLDPANIPYSFKLYGHNWEKHGKFSAYTLGPINYFDTVEKYLETSLVIDDANIATKKWGSVNCRVFDSLALGIDVITNGSIGAAEIFGDLLTTYDSKESLTTNIIKYLETDKSNSITSLQDIVLNNHTYDNRAEQIWNDIDELLSSKHVRIHTSIPKPSYSLQWGDLYLARAIRYELQKSNLRCNISVGENNERRFSSIEDLALNLQGIERVKQINKQDFLNWFISHPESYEISELVEFDNIAVSSKQFTQKIESLRSGFNDVKPLYLPQFSTIKAPETLQKALFDFIFVGNTRNIYRESVQYAIKLGLDVRVIGSGWDTFIDQKYILKNLVSNSELGSAYALGRVVLCDHWEDMKKFGFVSNRIYDCLSIGKPILTDYVKDIESDLTDDEKKYIFTYSSFEDFRGQSLSALSFSNEISDTHNSLDSKSAYRGLRIISDHVKKILDN